MRFLVSFLTLVLLFGLSFAQQPRPEKKPILIRDDPTEKKAQEEVIQVNPKTAAEHVAVGDFYFKRDNYKAAEERYREAIKFNPRSVEAFEKLVRTLEKQKAFDKAVEVCEQFVVSNPAAKEIPRFQARADELKTKANP